ncbi:MAG TPA: hypothetical protein VFB33_04710 [Candidatus Binataceae bacterium]|nr:hypothetical protein [Candidatus Binataceae bacterium]
MRKSHFLPAALWLGVRDPGLKNPNPVVMTRTISKTSSSQLVNRLLCSDCEDRFNKNGERYVLSWLSPKKAAQGSFPLLERLGLALPVRSSPMLNAYEADRAGIDTAKFGYFALSVLWRAAVQRWRMPDGTLTQKIELGELEKPLRRYLISDEDLPCEFVLILTVCSDRESRQTIYPPAARRDATFPAYGMLLLGVHFNIIIGRDLPRDLRDLCCMRSQQRPIFLRDCYDDTFRGFSTLASTSRPVANLR